MKMTLIHNIELPVNIFDMLKNVKIWGGVKR
jgi:hypothetical protein